VTVIQLEPLLKRARRRAVLDALRSHPDWNLQQLVDVLDRGSSTAIVLGSLTIGELLEDVRVLRDTADPPIDRRRLAMAQQQSGAEFDALVRDVLVEADGRLIRASYLRARVGGPRWKLQAALRRLVAAGLVERSGTTGMTRYRIREAESK
jgi:DNA-binding IclR family transcriptional regulator